MLERRQLALLYTPAHSIRLLSLRACRSYSNDNNNNNSESSAIARRLEQLLEEAGSTNLDRKAGKPVDRLPSDKNDELNEIESLRLRQLAEGSTFKKDNAQALSALKIPSTAPKQSRAAALDKPWEGNESQSDTVLRMLTDKYKPLKGSSTSSGRTASSTSKLTAAKLVSAKESLETYTKGKEEDYAMVREKLEGAKFKEYDISAYASLEGFAALAERKIQAAQQQGLFKNLPGAGKPAEKDHLAQSPYLDPTEYFLNRIIQKQGSKPPWIQAQQELEEAMNVFRRSLQAEWRRHVARRLASEGGKLSDQVHKAKELANYEKHDRDRAFRSLDWEAREKSYHELQIKQLNLQIRDYNAIAPYSVRRPYITLPAELSLCFRTVAPQVAQEIEERARDPRPSKQWLSAGKSPAVSTSLNEFYSENRANEVDMYAEQYGQSWGLRSWWRSLFVR